MIIQTAFSNFGDWARRSNENGEVKITSYAGGYDYFLEKTGTAG